MANFNNVKGLTLAKEGGLSRAKTDNAKDYPSSCVHNGYNDWHTNRGITYKTFVSFSKNLGYQPTCDNFINMPDDIWMKIAKKGFWDNLNLDSLKSDGIAIQLFSFHWGAGYRWFPKLDDYLTSKGISWNQKASTMADSVNKLIDKQGEKQTIDDLDEIQQKYYISLNQPANTKGWINRIKDTTQFAYSYIGKVYKENKKTINYTLFGIVLIGVTTLSYWYYKKRK
jgi:hypothetical protein